jgi:hypothetical protein
MKRIVARVLVLVAVLVGAVPALAAGPGAGEVIFLVGEAKLLDGAGKSKALSKGDVIMAEHAIETGANGHVHLRMIDNAFVSLRPNTRFRIETYRYDPADSTKNQVKFVLEKGVARNITGAAGQTNKRSYRLNTPVAAIGVRGTDYVVHVLPEATRVSVNAGAIVMAPFGDDCKADALGPCESAQAALLTAAMRNAYLELRARDAMPVLVPAERALDAPNRAVPPHPSEPRAGAAGGEQVSKVQSGGGVTEALTEIAANDIKQTANLYVAGLPAPIVPIIPDQIWWGRWSAFVNPGEPQNKVTALLAPDRELVVSNPVFGLLRQTGMTHALPPGGEVQFQLARSEAYIREGNQLNPAGISNAALAMNFDQRRFATNLTVQSATLNAPLNLHAEGAIRPWGIFVDDRAASNMRVEGAIAPQATQAGYLFMHEMTAGRSAIGATQWLR